MNNLPTKCSEALDIDYFTSKGEMVQYAILEYMDRTNDIVGSWMLKVVLEGKGIDISIASIGRALKELDAKGFTEAKTNKGRAITEEGRQYLSTKKEVVERRLLQKRLLKSAKPEDFNQLLDLNRARRSLEVESARLAAIRLTDESREKIYQSLNTYMETAKSGQDPTDKAFDFHIVVAEASKNKFIKAAIELLIYYNTELELLFPELITRELGSEYSVEHQRIAEAIFRQDPTEAEKQMHIHMTSIIEAIKKQGKIINGDN